VKRIDTVRALVRPSVLAMKVVTTFYRRVDVMARALDGLPSTESKLAARIAPLAPEELDAYMIFRPEQRADRIRARLAAGHRAFVVWYAGGIVHAAWMATGRVYVPYLRQDIALEPADVFTYDSFTLPAFRHHGLVGARIAHALRHYAERGFQRSLALVAVENRPSFLAVSAAGYRPLGRFLCLRVGPWQRIRAVAYGEERLPRLCAPRAGE
jgi:hypothetical protein